MLELAPKPVLILEVAAGPVLMLLFRPLIDARWAPKPLIDFRSTPLAILELDAPDFILWFNFEVAVAGFEPKPVFILDVAAGPVLILLFNVDVLEVPAVPVFILLLRPLIDARCAPRPLIDFLSTPPAMLEVDGCLTKLLLSEDVRDVAGPFFKL